MPWLNIARSPVEISLNEISLMTQVINLWAGDNEVSFVINILERATAKTFFSKFHYVHLKFEESSRDDVDEKFIESFNQKALLIYKFHSQPERRNFVAFHDKLFFRSCSYEDDWSICDDSRWWKWKI